MDTLTPEVRLAEARKLIEIAKKELTEAEMEVIRKDAKLVIARDYLRLLQAQILAETSSFK